MDFRKIHISGQMGNQLLRYFIIMADSRDKNYEIECIIVTGFPNYLEQLFELNIPTTTWKDVKINDIDHNLEENVHKLFTYRNRLLDNGLIKIRKHREFTHAKTCIHLRGTDKKVAPLRWYYRKIKFSAQSGTVHVCSDDAWRSFILKIWLVCTGIKDVVFTNQDAISDWFTLLHADRIYCSSSSFPLSTLLLNPEKEIIVCSRKSSNNDYSIPSGKIAEFQFISTAMEYCPNLRLED